MSTQQKTIFLFATFCLYFSYVYGAIEGKRGKVLGPIGVTTANLKLLNKSLLRYPRFFPSPPISPRLTFCAGTQKDVGGQELYGSAGAAGPTQFVACINSLIRSFKKSSGKRDRQVECDVQAIFNDKSVKVDTLFPTANSVITLTHPRLRYDRHARKWFLLFKTEERDKNSFKIRSNGLLIIVIHDATIDEQTRWSLFSIRADKNEYFDYPTLGVDQHSLLIGVNVFEVLAGKKNFKHASAFVVNKRGLVSAQSVIVHTRFDFPQASYCPWGVQGVNNFDENPPFGYFIGSDRLSQEKLFIFRFSYKTLGPRAFLDVKLLPISVYAKPINVDHLGNNYGEKGMLDGFDARLMCAHIRNNNLWTVHGIGVNNIGLSSPYIAVSRNGCRWYEIDLSNSNPRLVQSGVLIKSTPHNDIYKASYWHGSLMTNGQGHMVLGCHKSGIRRYIDAAYGTRICDYPHGKIIRPARLTTSKHAYNPPLVKNEKVRKLGEYSETSLDPSDDMTMWTIQPYCCEKNRWGLCVAKIMGPPPAKPIKSYPSKISKGKDNVHLTIIGFRDHRIDIVSKINKIYEDKTAFFDPGHGFSSRLRVEISGGVKVKGVVYKGPFEIALTVSTVHAQHGSQDITIENPDGQRVVARNLVNVV